MVASAHIAATDALVTPCGLRCIMRHDSIFDFSAMYIYILFACLYRMLPTYPFLHFFITYLLHYLSFPLRIDPLCSVIVKGS